MDNSENVNVSQIFSVFNKNHQNETFHLGSLMNHSNQDSLIHNKGKWSVQQKLFYADFLQKNIEMFRCEEIRRSSRIFNLMANQIKTRDSDQCRSHHQKMMNYHRDLNLIVRSHYYRVHKNNRRRNKSEIEVIKKTLKKTTDEEEESIAVEFGQNNKIRIVLDVRKIRQYLDEDE